MEVISLKPLVLKWRHINTFDSLSDVEFFKSEKEAIMYCILNHITYHHTGHLTVWINNRPPEFKRRRNLDVRSTIPE
jgi:hypothetical protein